MTELIERASAEGPEEGSASSGPPGPPTRGIRRLGRARLLLIALALVVVAAVVGAVVATSGSPKHASAPYTSVTVRTPLYTPTAVVGSTDDYHCNLVNPHITQNSFVVSSQFTPGSAEDHHAVLSLVPPSLAATALRDNAQTGGHGWTCFGAPSLPGASLAAFLSTPFLSVWTPGHGTDTLPKGTGISLPAGSLVIEQVHYNLLVGDKPVSNSLVLDTVPASAPLQRLHLDLSLAPPDLPCPAGVTGPLCDRAASVADQAHRFGQEAAEIVGGIEGVCGHDPATAAPSDTATCSWRIDRDGYIVRAQAHMHLLGTSFTMVVDPGTPQARTVIDVPNYNFDYQKAYNLSTPIPVKAGDRLQVNCTYNPKLAQELPALRKAPPHYVTWGDGSSDEMCIGLAWTSPVVPNAHSSV